MPEDLILKWQIQTGYVQNIPDNETEIDIDDLTGHSDTRIEEHLFDVAREDFMCNYGVATTNSEEVIQAVRDHEAEQQSNAR